MEIQKIPTTRNGVFLKTVTELDDTAWLLTNRRFDHPVPPNKIGAPDHEVFLKLRKIRSQADPDITNYGIWDIKSFENIAFIGYASLVPRQYKASVVAEVGCEIANKYQRRGYATTALRALINYAREAGGFDTIISDVLPSNIASQKMVQALGFDRIEQRPGHIIYAQSPAPAEA